MDGEFLQNYRQRDRKESYEKRKGDISAFLSVRVCMCVYVCMCVCVEVRERVTTKASGDIDTPFASGNIPPRALVDRV